jgi:hypothetical protein
LIKWVVLGANLVGLLPLGIGVLASLLAIIGYCYSQKKNCCQISSSIFSVIVTILYIILALVFLAMLVVVNDAEILALIEETIQ